MATRHPSQLQTPGFWDLHIHGVAGIDFMHATPKQMVEACEILGRRGISAFAPTLLTSKPKLLIDACKRWGAFLADLNVVDRQVFFSPLAAIPVGLHLEGPFLNPEMSGAHPKSSLHKPDLKYARKLYEAARGQVAIMTIAPELKGAPELIKALAKIGIRIQIGHTNADSATIAKACACGASGVTHLFNAMKIHHRSEGPLPHLLKEELTAEIITDGAHISYDYFNFAFKSAGNSLYSVTDACSALGSKTGAKLSLGDLQLSKSGDLALVKSTGTLAGGASWMTDHPARIKKALKNMCPTESKIFPLFHAHQARFFPRVAALTLHRKNIFDPVTWKFIDSHSG